MKLFVLALCLFVCVSGLAFAQEGEGEGEGEAEADIPDVLGAGAGVGDYMDAAITAMGLLVVTALGGMVAFLGIRKGFAWVRRSVGYVDSDGNHKRFPR